MRRVLSGCAESLVCTAICSDSSTPNLFTMLSDPCIPPPGAPGCPGGISGPGGGSGTVGPPANNTTGGTTGVNSVTSAGTETCRFPKLEECAHFHYERVQLPRLEVVLKEDMEVSLHSQHALNNSSPDTTYFTLQVTCRDECWLIQRSLDNFAMLDAQLHQCIYDRKVSQLPDLQEFKEKKEQRERKRRRCKSEGSVQEDDEESSEEAENLEATLSAYLYRLCLIANNSLNCGPVLNWFQLDNRGHRLLVPSEESRSINTPAVAAAYSVRRYVSQARDELSLEVGDMISVIDMASPGESVWWRGKRGFQVGFFPQHCVHIIGDKVPRNMPLPPPVVGSLAISPIKPVLRKHGKLITFFRSFILNRPSRRRLKQSGILKERVFGCDLGEHLLNSGHGIPMVLKCCAEFIESHGIVDGIYRLSGVTSNIQKLRNAFDEDRIPNLYTDDILQDIHSVASLLKMYFRELPNPLCTYQLYHSFVSAVQGCSASRNKANDNERLLKMREAVQKLPPPHYRTLEYLMRHLQLISTHGHNTGMTTRNLAIVWAPNLLRCEELEIGGVAALQGVGVQAVVTEFLVCYADLIFSEKVPIETQTVNQLENNHDSKSNISQNDEKRSRPKSLAISTPTKLLTLEEARNKHLLMKDEGSYIEVGGGPKSLPKKYHTVIELPAGSRKRGLSKRSPSGWRSFFSKSRNSSHGNLSKNRDISSPGIVPIDKSVTESDLNDIKRKLRPVKSAESLTSGQSEPATCEGDVLGPLHCLSKPQGHNRSVSHDSYFDNLQSSQNNSVGSLLDLSEIQLNFELEESEMRIFSEDESLVSSPKVQKEAATRKSLNRARPEEFSSAANSSNPSPKKQPRVVISPDSLSRKRSRLEDQLSDIQYIDCTTPDNNVPCLISTTALIHHNDDSSSSITNLNPSGGTSQLFEGYQPKNKSPRNSEMNRHSLNFEKIDKTSLPKSLTDLDLKKTQCLSLNLTPTPGTPNYKPLNETSSTNSPNMSPDFTRGEYENLNSPKSNSGYENILTTISITYKSPTKSRNNSDNIYEDIELNPEKAVVPTTVASLPIQEATQPILELSDSSSSKSPRVSLETTFDASITTICSEDSATLKEEIPLERPTDLKFSPKNPNEDKSFDSTTKSLELSTTYKSIDSLSSTPNTPNNSKKSLITPTEEISVSNPNSTTELTNSSSSTKSSMSPVEDDEDKTADSLLSDSDSSQKKVNNNDKRKSCEAELLDENAIYQQVKYFRRSIHEINSLLDLPLDEPSSTSTPENFDSLEADNVHVYENVEVEEPRPNKTLDLPRNRMHEASPKKIDLPEETPQDLPVCAKCADPVKINVKNLTSKFETKEKAENIEEKSTSLQKKYDKDGLPPCLRAKNAKNSIKTRSLDENAFVTEFGRSTSLQRRKSLDDRTSSYINSKILTDSPKTSSSTTDIRSESQRIIKNALEPLGTEKLNRERIEKYKEERRNFWREKYRSESFKEDKDKLLSRLKQKSFSKTLKTEETPPNKPPEDLSSRLAKKTEETTAKKLPIEALSKFEGATTKLRKKNSPLLDRKHRPSLKELSDQILDESTDEATIMLRGGKEEEFLRHRRGDSDSKEEKSERRRHTYDLLREREIDTEGPKRVSLEAKSNRKEKCSPSYCIKDMKAIFESKSQQ